MSKVHLSLPIALILLISGCISAGPVSGNSVVIEAFEPDFSEVFSGEPVQLQLKLRNTGSVDAEDVEAEILNFEWESAGSTDCRESRMLPPDPARGTQGGTKLCIFEYEAPSLSKGMSLSYSPTVRVMYDYSTTSVKSLTILPIADARRLQQQGRTFAAETVSSTSSPVKLDITTKGPIRVFRNQVEFPLEIKVSNAGGGTVCESDCSETDQWNKLDVDVDASGFTTTGECGGEITLFKGQSSTITCNLGADTEDQPVQRQITVSASYSYMVEDSTAIEVTGV